MIPTINEEDGIGLTITELPLRTMQQMGFSCEIVVVDGGSSDHTWQEAKKCGAIVVHEPREGYGRAYKTGFNRSVGDILVTLDGDHSYPASAIPHLVRKMVREDLDFITTNRFQRQEAGAISSIHMLGNKVLSAVVSILFLVRMKDSQSGMWLVRRSSLDSILPISNGMPFSQEIKIRASKLCRWEEVPVHYRKRLGARKIKTFSHGIQNLLHLLLLRVLFSVRH